MRSASPTLCDSLLHVASCGALFCSARHSRHIASRHTVALAQARPAIARVARCARTTLVSFCLGDARLPLEARSRSRVIAGHKLVLHSSNWQRRARNASTTPRQTRLDAALPCLTAAVSRYPVIDCAGTSTSNSAQHEPTRCYTTCSAQYMGDTH